MSVGRAGKSSRCLIFICSIRALKQKEALKSSMLNLILLTVHADETHMMKHKHIHIPKLMAQIIIIICNVLVFGFFWFLP